MKKAVSIVMALIMCAGMATVALGDNYHQDGDASTLISFEWKNDPTYSMTIPESVVMTNEGVDVDFTASDVEYMEGKELVVSISCTDKFRDQMLLSSTDSNHSVRYQLVTPDGRVLETTGGNINGTEIVSFTEDGVQTVTFRPVLVQTSSAQPGRTYTGSIFYNFSVVEISG